jgi:hypothetical protein
MSRYLQLAAGSLVLPGFLLISALLTECLP